MRTDVTDGVKLAINIKNTNARLSTEWNDNFAFPRWNLGYFSNNNTCHIFKFTLRTLNYTLRRKGVR